MKQGRLHGTSMSAALLQYHKCTTCEQTGCIILLLVPRIVSHSTTLLYPCYFTLGDLQTTLKLSYFGSGFTVLRKQGVLY